MKILECHNFHNTGNIKPETQIRVSGATYKSDVLILNNKQKKQPSFCKLTINIEVPNFIINSRVRKLKKLGLSEFYAQRLARLDSTKYKKALELISIGVFEESIEDTTKLDEEEYKKALELVKHDIANEDLAFFAKLEEKEYNRIIELKDKGIDTEQLSLFISLKENEYQQAIELMKKGYTPVEAACFASLTEEQKEIALSLKKQKVPIEIASEIARMEPLQRDNNIDLIKRGISAEEVQYITDLDEENKKRINEIISFDLGDENITDFALFSDKDYTKAITLFKSGVLPKYIPSIIAIENGETINRTYEEYRKRGYSRNISYALSLLLSFKSPIKGKDITKIIPIIAITTITSTNVNPLFIFFVAIYSISIIHLSIYETNSSFISSNLSSVFASNLAVILGPVLLALTRAQESSNKTFTPSISKYEYFFSLA